jgi:hypothetical protein
MGPAGGSPAQRSLRAALVADTRRPFSHYSSEIDTGLLLVDADDHVLDWLFTHGIDTLGRSDRYAAFGGATSCSGTWRSCGCRPSTSGLWLSQSRALSRLGNFPTVADIALLDAQQIRCRLAGDVGRPGLLLGTQDAVARRISLQPVPGLCRLRRPHTGSLPLVGLTIGRRIASRPVLYAHGEMYGLVTVMQGSPYIGNAVTHPRYMFWRANFLKAVQIGPKCSFSGDLCA